MSKSSKKYKHHISPDLFKEAILASQEEFKQKKEEYNAIGIQRKEEKIIHLPGALICTVISDAIIGSDDTETIIDGTDREEISHIFFKNCEVLNLKVKNISAIFDDFYTIFNFKSCNISQILVDNCNISNIWLKGGSKAEFIGLRGESTAGGIMLGGESKAETIVLRGGSEANITLDAESKANQIRIRGGSKAETIVLRGGSEANITLDAESKANQIRIRGGSKAVQIALIGKSEAQLIALSEGSEVSAIKIRVESAAEEIVLRGGSEAETIALGGGSEANSIALRGKSKAGAIRLSDRSEAGKIRLREESGAGKIRLREESKAGAIVLRGGSEAETIRLEKSKVGRMWLAKKSKAGSIGLEEKSKARWIELTRESEAGVIQLEEGSKAHSIRLNRESKAESIRLEKSEAGRIELSGQSEVQRIIMLSWESAAGTIRLDEKSKAQRIGLKKKSMVNNIFFTEASIASFEAVSSMLSIKTIDSLISEMLIQDSYITKFRLGGQSTTEAFIKNSSIGILDLQQTVLYEETSVTFSSVKIYACLLEQLTVLGHLFFRDMSALQTPFELPGYASDKIKRSYKNLIENPPERTSTKKSVFRLTHSSLGQTEFIDSDLEGFERFEFSHSRITEIFISGLKAPTKIFIRGLEESEHLADDWEKEEQKVSLYNQFAQISKEQGFIFNAVKFRSQSALHQQKILWKKLTASRSKKGNNSDSKRSVLLEYLPFFLNRWSNNHGESWARALLFILATSSLLYIGYIYSMESPAEPLQNSFFVQLGYYFEFINPFRPFDFMSDVGYKMNALTRLLDLLSRLIIGYGIYQFLTAFRKYKKK